MKWWRQSVNAEPDGATISGVAIALGTTMVLVLWTMGRTPWGAAAGPGLWTGDIDSQLCSQLLADPYTFSHIVHGLLFYLLLWLGLDGRLAERWRLVVATGIEATWEVVENTPMVIERFREATIAQGYYGDSILNSTGDLMAMAAGFAVAMHLRNRWVVALLVAIELALAYAIRDNMTLNLIMLIYPIPGLREWQANV